MATTFKERYANKIVRTTRNGSYSKRHELSLKARKDLTSGSGSSNSKSLPTVPVAAPECNNNNNTVTPQQCHPYTYSAGVIHSNNGKEAHEFFGKISKQEDNRHGNGVSLFNSERNGSFQKTYENNNTAINGPNRGQVVHKYSNVVNHQNQTSTSVNTDIYNQGALQQEYRPMDNTTYPEQHDIKQERHELQHQPVPPGFSQYYKQDEDASFRMLRQNEKFRQRIRPFQQRGSQVISGGFKVNKSINIVPSGNVKINHLSNNFKHNLSPRISEIQENEKPKFAVPYPINDKFGLSDLRKIVNKTGREPERPVEERNRREPIHEKTSSSNTATNERPITENIKTKQVETNQERSPIKRNRQTVPIKKPLKAKIRKKPSEINEGLVKSQKDLLIYTKKSRKVDYQPCTTKQYLEDKPKGYYELGKLKPDLTTKELKEKRANVNKVKEFSRNLRKVNASKSISKTTTGHHRIKLPSNIPKIRSLGQKIQTSFEENEFEIKKKRAHASRTRAMEFAKTVPKPRVKSASPRISKVDYESTPQNQNSALDELERKHDRDRLEIEAIRREFRMMM